MNTILYFIIVSSVLYYNIKFINVLNGVVHLIDSVLSKDYQYRFIVREFERVRFCDKRKTRCHSDKTIIS